MSSSESGGWPSATRIGIVVGLFAAAIELHLLIQDARSTLDAVKLEALNHVLPLIDTEYEVRQSEVLFLDKELEGAMKKLDEEFLAEGRSGKAFYMSDEADGFRDVTGHYEKLGAVLKLEYLEFNLIFDIVPFPEEFWHGTAKLRTKISQNWDGVGQPLPDFLENFEWLCLKYKSARVKAGNKQASDRLICKNKT